MDNGDVILRWPIVWIQAQSSLKILQRALPLPYGEERVAHVVQRRPIAGLLHESTFVISQRGSPIVSALFNDAEIVKSFGKMRFQLHRTNQCVASLIRIVIQISPAKIEPNTSLARGMSSRVLPQCHI